MGERDFYIEHIRKDDCLRKRPFSNEDFYELSYFVVGERKYIIDDVIYKIKPGMLVLSKKDKNSKTTIHNESSYERILVRFHKSYFDDFQCIFNGHDLLSVFNQNTKILKLDYDRKEKLESLLLDMVSIGFQAGTYQSLQTKLNLSLVLVLINEHIETTDAKNLVHFGEKNPKISEIITYINANYTENITLNHLSQKFFISPFYLSKLFKQITNFTVVQYLNSIRVKKAKYHLVNTDDKIIDIAFRVGFNSNTHFTRVFSQVCNESPNQFRKNQQFKSNIINE